MQYFFENIKNNLDFFLREKFAFSRKNYSEPNESKENLFNKDWLYERENYLLDKYDLTELKSSSTVENYLQNLDLINLFDKYINIEFKDNLNVLDLGCKNWFNAPADYLFLKKQCKKLNLDGIELDSNRLYSNFFSRREAAKFYTRNIKGARYVHANFLDTRNIYDYIIWVLPFVVKDPLIKWGLPQKYFQPQKMLLHAYNSINTGGKIFIFNQGEAEFQVQKELCDTNNLPYTAIGCVENDFYTYPKRHLLIVNK